MDAKFKRMLLYGFCEIGDCGKCPLVNGDFDWDASIERCPDFYNASEPELDKALELIGFNADEQSGERPSKETEVDDGEWKQLIELIDDYGEAEYFRGDYHSTSAQNDSLLAYDKLISYIKELLRRKEE